MKWDASNVNVEEWGDTSVVVAAMKGLKDLDRLPRQLLCSYTVRPTGDNAVAFPITWTYHILQNEAPIFTYKGTVRATIEKGDSPPSLKEIYDMIHNILFFRFTLYFYMQWQGECPGIDSFAVEFDELLKNKDFFDLADEIRMTFDMK